MKLKDLINETKNSKNKQINWSLKKRKLKECGISKEDLLNIKVDPRLKGLLE